MYLQYEKQALHTCKIKCVWNSFEIMVNFLEMFTLALLISLLVWVAVVYALHILLLVVFVCDRKTGSREYEIY
jgi:hypothetical protein